MDGIGALILGPSGAGKSDLALRAVSGTWRGDGGLIRPVLVADDQVLVSVRNGGLIARAPATIAGRIEVRGLGILDITAIPEARVGLAVALVAPGEVERHPDPPPSYGLLGCTIPLLRLAPFEASAALKLALALARLAGAAGPRR